MGTSSIAELAPESTLSSLELDEQSVLWLEIVPLDEGVYPSQRRVVLVLLDCFEKVVGGVT